MGIKPIHYLPLVFSMLMLSQVIPFAQAEILLDVEEEYSMGDRVLITGRLTQGGSVMSPVTIQIVHGERFIRADVLPPAPDGSFSLSFDIGRPLWVENETYEVRAYTGHQSAVKTFKIVSGNTEPNDTIGGMETSTISTLEEANQGDTTSTLDENAEIIELIQNGSFENGLQHWKIGVFEYSDRNEQFKELFQCGSGSQWGLCKAEGWGYPRYSVTDNISIGDKQFYANVPSFFWNGRTAVSLSQEIHIPTSERVTLSFDAQGVWAPQLHIFVTEIGQSEPNLFNQFEVQRHRGLGDVVQREYDLTSFSGKTVTLMFVASQIDHPKSYETEVLDNAVYLDDISLTVLNPVVTPYTPEITVSFWVIVLVPIVGGFVVAILITTSKKTGYAHKPEPKAKVSSPFGTMPKQTIKQKDPTVHEEPFLEKGGRVPDELKRKPKDEEPLEVSEKKAEITEPEKAPEPPIKEELQSQQISDVDLIRHLRNAKYLRCLWALYQKEDHYFENLSAASKEIRGTDKRSGRGDQRIFSEMKTLKEHGLVNMIKKTDYQSTRKRSIFGFGITPLGMEYMEKSLAEKITNWDDFKQKYLKDNHPKNN